MYVGAGSGPLTEAAAAWAGLADEVGSAADACTATLSQLTGGGWHGPSAASMAAAAAPYAAWLRETAGHAARAASQASAAASAYQTTFAAMVPPPVIAENRARLVSLTATNLLGQNTPAIAATEAAYSAMWAQDATAMYRYAGDSAAAAALNPLGTPPATTTGTAGQAAATTHATATAASSAPSTLSQLLAPSMGGWNIFSPANGSSDLGLSGLLNMLSGATHSSLGNFLNDYFNNSVFSSGFENPTGIFNVFNAFDYLLIYAAQDAMASNALGAGGLGVLGPMTSQIHSIGAVPAGAGTLAGVHGGQPEVTAGVGEAKLVRTLSVPPRWAAATASAVAAGTAAIPGTSALPLGVGAGSTMLPGAPMPGAVRGKRRARRYGFRPVVVAHPPAGG